ncbi:hypothetical protein [Oerskovia turbata]
MTNHQTRPGQPVLPAAGAAAVDAARPADGPATRPTARRRSAPAALLVALLAVALSACAPDAAPGVASAGDGDASSSTEQTGKSAEDLTDAEREDLAREFARCMRENGVDMPDPGADGGGVITLDGSTDEGAMDAAFEACKEFLPDGGEPAKLSPEDLEAQRKYAQCMREQGIDMPDPDPNGGMTMAGEVGDIEAFEAALEACDEVGATAGLGFQSDLSGGDK